MTNAETQALMKGILAHYDGEADRRKVRAFLLRVLLELDWSTVGTMIRRSGRQARELAKEGRQMLLQANEDGWLCAEDLEALMQNPDAV